MQRPSKLFCISFLTLVYFATDAFPQKRGGELRVAMNRTFNGFDTASSPTVFPTKLNVQRAIYEDLFTLDKKAVLIGVRSLRKAPYLLLADSLTLWGNVMGMVLPQRPEAGDPA